MNIVQATSENLEQLAPLFDGYRIFYKRNTDLGAARRFLKERLEKKDSIIFLVLDESNKGLGFTQLYPSYSSVSLQRTFILNDLYVSEFARGKGIGEALMERAKKFAIEVGSKGLTLETATDNPAQKLYKKLGWMEDSFVKHYTWEV